MNSPGYFEIQAHNVAELKDFYEKLFGWRFTKAEGTPIEYWLIETEGIRGGLLGRPAPVPPPQSGTNAFVCSMQVEDFDSMAESILRMGGQVALPKFAIPGTCWQGYFIDPSGTSAFFRLILELNKFQTCLVELLSTTPRCIASSGSSRAVR